MLSILFISQRGQRHCFNENNRSDSLELNSHLIRSGRKLKVRNRLPFVRKTSDFVSTLAINGAEYRNS